MSKVESSSFAVTTTGGDTILLNDDTINISKLILFVATSSTETSVGFHDSSTDFTGSSAYSEANTTKPLTHWRNISGTKTKMIECTVTSTGTVGEFSINTSTLVSATIVHYVAFGS